MRATRPALLAALLLAGCPAHHLPTLEPGTFARCPAALTDAALDDLASYLDCPLPVAVARLVRSDYADDELRPADWSALERYSGQVSAAAFLHQLDSFVSPDGALLPWVELNRDRGLLRPDPVLAPDLELALAPGPASTTLPGRLQVPASAAPFRASRRAELLKQASTERPLAGLRVLLDPGHIGGAMAAFESRELLFVGPNGEKWEVREGELTFRTALEAKAKLERLGAEVRLTREEGRPGHPYPLSSFRPSADRLLRHLAQDPAFRDLERSLSVEARRRLRVAVALHAVKKQFLFETLRHRVEEARAEPPDLMISIHYNATPGAPGRRFPQHLVAMIRGNHEAVRLYNPYYRQRALRDAFEVAEFNASAHLAERCLRHMSQALGLPVVQTNPYPDHRPVLRADGTPSGVDAWNGVLLRYADWPSVLTEGPMMDELDEMPRLDTALRAPLHTPGTRTEQYAEGLARGVEEWARQWLAQERDDFGPL